MQTLPRLRLTLDDVRPEERVITNLRAIDEHRWTPYFSVQAYLTNDPLLHSDDSVAHGISAHLTYRDDSGRTAFSITGRWGDMQQPAPNQPQLDLYSATFEIGQRRELDLVFKLRDDEDCHAFNNDSYGHADFKNPRQRIDGERFMVDIRLRGPKVDEMWRAQIRNPGPGQQFQVLAVHSVPKPRV